MIPVLAVGALIKYIFCGRKKCRSTCSKCGTTCDVKEIKEVHEEKIV
jgi:hypothetical protein